MSKSRIVIFVICVTFLIFSHFHLSFVNVSDQGGQAFRKPAPILTTYKYGFYYISFRNVSNVGQFFILVRVECIITLKYDLTRMNVNSFQDCENVNSCQK